MAIIAKTARPTVHESDMVEFLWILDSLAISAIVITDHPRNQSPTRLKQVAPIATTVSDAKDEHPIVVTFEEDRVLFRCKSAKARAKLRLKLANPW